jgi:hypothetical protein
MNIQMARFRIKSSCLAELEEAAGSLFWRLRESSPWGMHFALSILSDSVKRLVLIELKHGVKNRLPGLPKGKQFLVRLPSSIAGPPIREQ